jgi:hypothetical protein
MRGLVRCKQVLVARHRSSDEILDRRIRTSAEPAKTNHPGLFARIVPLSQRVA